ncbi:uncharacterized protein LOC126893836 isoform X2 [Daktulosphaira vitifoliae]|uniref:uncharacterized protein LOC126893836 isoform X2 n=1 Tax=Daktulosphaira vitifoliae TaxID=58002 RepID=UPI0021AA3A7E|nr:uncharacterized protein LOC126893836 isoform X2 [Daktulosphaira vitifoliae]
MSIEMKVFFVILLAAYVDISAAAGTSNSNKCVSCNSEDVHLENMCFNCLMKECNPTQHPSSVETFETPETSNRMDISAAAGTSNTNLCPKNMCIKCNGAKKYIDNMCENCVFKECIPTGSSISAFCLRCSISFTPEYTDNENLCPQCKNCKTTSEA